MKERIVPTVNEIRIKAVPILRLHRVCEAAIFGSVARGEARQRSDIDLLVTLAEGKSLLDLVGLQLDLEAVLGRKVDLVTYGSLHPRIRDQVLKEQIPLI